MQRDALNDSWDNRPVMSGPPVHAEVGQEAIQFDRQETEIYVPQGSKDFTRN